MTRRFLQSADIEIDEATGAILVQGDFYTAPTLLGGPTLVTVDNTLNGKSLVPLLGAEINDSLNRLVLIPTAAGIFWAAGAASDGSAPLPAGGIDIPIDKTAAETLRFFASENVTMTVLQFG